MFAKVAVPQDADGYEVSVRGRITDAGTTGFDTYQATYVERGAVNDEYRLWKAVSGEIGGRSSSFHPRPLSSRSVRHRYGRGHAGRRS